VEKENNELVISDIYLNNLSKSDLPDKISKYGLIFMLILIGLLFLLINRFF